jgi:hypothetical protein
VWYTGYWMPDVSDFDLLKTPNESRLPQRSIGAWVAIALLIVAAVAGLYYAFWYRRPAQVVTTEPKAAPRAADRPLGAAGEPVTLPPLNETDAVVRELVKKVSSHPSVAAWLATDDLIRHFTIGVTDVASGKTATRQLVMLRPSASFRVIQRGNDLVIDPRSYTRYDGIAAAAASMDADGSARLYATLKPRIEEAAKELGDTSFDRTLERAIVRLLQTPSVDDPIRVEPRGVGYGFADPRLEELSAAQKHLLRTGPRNALVIQTSLRAIALALGIPAERLPQSTPVTR